MMNFILFVCSVYVGWVGGKKSYHFWLSKQHGKINSKLGAISAGFFISIFSFIILNGIFDTAWTAVVFIILCFLTWNIFKNPEQFTASGTKQLTRKQVITSFGVISFILMMFGIDTSPQASTVAPASTSLPVVAQVIEPIPKDDHSKANPFDDGSVSSGVENTEVASTATPESTIEPDVTPVQEPIPEPVEETSVFNERDNNSCGGLPARCTEMRDCAQAEQALACGNSRLDRDNDGIPCESICG